MTNQDTCPTPIDDEQLQLYLEAIQAVTESPSGCGTVITTIKDGRVTFIQYSPSLDARPHHVTDARIYLQEQREKKNKRSQ